MTMLTVTGKRLATAVSGDSYMFSVAHPTGSERLDTC